MTLMRVLIDKRTNAGLAGNSSNVYAHGLPRTPDTVDIRFVTNLATTTGVFVISAPADATNITIQNAGASPSPDMEIVAMCIHSWIQ